MDAVRIAWWRCYQPPHQKTANAQQCRCHKALVRNTVAMFSRLRVGGPASRNSGKIRDGQDGGRNLSTWASFRGPTNPPLGHAVQVIQHEPPNKPTSTERLRAAIDRIRGKTHQDDLPATDQDDPLSTH